MIRISFISIILFFIINSSTAQTFRSGDSTINVMRAIIVGHDTILVSDIPEVNIYPRREFKNRFQYYRYRTLIRNVKAAYPYAKLASEKLLELDKRLANMSSERQRKANIDEYEKELREEFEDKLTHLTISQGRILIKLIDREMDQTTFLVITNVKGKFKAVFWQGVARIFGSNLKSEYNPEDEDAMIEEIIIMIEAGRL
ncbi:MAG: DUF4294 domain-containing protein [Bacteroidales bacterium]|nr:DUF4294 domain-containing protein [Bacteroidales bacterium]MCF8389236.1 DUF4294 domain-containing protein [Bacteroidales bacterium]